MEICSICLSEIVNIVTLNCNHSFCMGCIDRLFRHKKNQCPLCRNEIKELLNNEEKIKVVFHEIEVNSVDNENFLVTQRIMLRYKLKYYLSCILLLYNLYLVINGKLDYEIIHTSLTTCNDNVNNITDNFNALYNNYNKLYDNCLNNNYLSMAYVFKHSSNSLVSCSFPIYYIRKCFNS